MADDEPRVERRVDAAKAGRTIYIRQRPCPVCDSQEFYTNSGQCVPCTKERANRNNSAIRQAYREAKGLG